MCYDYILDRKRYRVKSCPCGKSNEDGKFIPFVDYEDKGYCHACRQTFYPVKNTNTDSNNSEAKQIQCEPEPLSYFTIDDMRATRNNYKNNALVVWIYNTFGSAITSKAIGEYNIGTYNDAVIFWHLDKLARVRYGKVMYYNKGTGKRIADIKPKAYHFIKNMTGNFRPPLFGEHLLATSDISKPVYLFESEKSCICLSHYFPEAVCLATGGTGGLTIKKAMQLARRRVVLFPDLDNTIWNDLTAKLNLTVPNATFEVNRFLIENKGLFTHSPKADMLDYVIEYHRDELELTPNEAAEINQFWDGLNKESEESERSEAGKIKIFL